MKLTLVFAGACLVATAAAAAADRKLGCAKDFTSIDACAYPLIDTLVETATTCDCDDVACMCSYRAQFVNELSNLIQACGSKAMSDVVPALIELCASAPASTTSTVATQPDGPVAGTANEESAAATPADPVVPVASAPPTTSSQKDAGDAAVGQPGEGESETPHGGALAPDQPASGPLSNDTSLHPSPEETVAPGPASTYATAAAGRLGGPAVGVIILAFIAAL